jgi:group I intron endonuclease
MTKICGIYKITSPKNKIYIGQSINIYSRWNEYKRLDCEGQILLYRSLVKYGVKTHKFEIIHECLREELNNLEEYYINLFQCFNNIHGLNLKSGGNVYELSDITKEKISKSKLGCIPWNKNIPCSQQTKDKIGKANKGKKHVVTEEQCRQRSLIRKGKTTYIITNEVRKNMRNGQLGRKMSKEAINKRIETMRNNNTLNRSNATKEKIKLKRIGNGKKIINTVTGFVYHNLSDAAQTINITKGYLGMQLRGKKTNNTNFKYL